MGGGGGKGVLVLEAVELDNPLENTAVAARHVQGDVTDIYINIAFIYSSISPLSTGI